MHPELEKLLELQSQDLVLLEAELRLKTVLDEVARLDAALDGARSEVTAEGKRVEDGVKRREELEVRIESYRVIQDRRRLRLEQARGAREAQALMTEVEMARSILAREENEWVKTAEGVHDLERGLKAAEERLAALEAQQGMERQRLADERRRLDSELEAGRAARDEYAVAVERNLRTRYDRLRSARTAAVVVPLRGDACGACFTAVPRNRRTQIRAGLVLDACEACGVILYAEVE